MAILIPDENDRISVAIGRIEELDENDLRDICYEIGVTEMRSLADRCKQLHELLGGIANDVESGTS